MTRMFSVVAAAFLLFSLTGGSPASAKTDHRLGTDYGDFEVLERAGMGWDRVDFFHRKIERQPGQFDWSEQDKLVADAAEHGVRILPIIWEAVWESGEDHAPATDEERATFAQFAYEAAKHFKGRIDAWEVWNEPNSGYFWRPDRNARDYTLLLKAVYPAIKSANPNAVVVGGALADIDGITDPGFLREMCRFGAADYMDALSIHPYRYGGNPEIKFPGPIQELRDILGKHGRPDVPIWISEIGWHTPGKGLSQAWQANYFIRSYLTSLASGVKVFIWYRYMDAMNMWSLAFQEGDQVREKAVLRATRACADIIADADLVGVMPWQDPLYGVVFRRENDIVVAAWRRYGMEEAPLPHAVQVIDQYGRPGAKPVLDEQVRYFILPLNSGAVKQVRPRLVEAEIGGAPPPLKWSHHTRKTWYSSPATGDINGDGKKEVLVASGEQNALICFSAQGKELWQIKSENSIPSSPVLADLDGDGKLEVLIGTNDKALWAVNGAGQIVWKAPLEATVDDSAPAAADLDSDGSPEVIIGAGNVVYCFDAGGKERWRYTMANLRGLNDAPKCAAPVAIGDADGDGKPNVIVGATDGSVRCLEGDGHEIWRVVETDEPCRSGPVIGDVDGDGQAEILVALDARSLYCLRGVDGRELWRFPLGGTVYTSIALGDINGDGKAEILCADILEHLYCLSNDGRLLWQWNAFGKLKSAPVLADVDGDGQIEVLIGDGEGWFSCLDDRARLKWRFTTRNDKEILESAAVADLDGDGRLELVFGCKHGDLECLSLKGAPEAKLMPWPSRRQDPAGRAMLPR